jgi:hypothetical protein
MRKDIEMTDANGNLYRIIRCPRGGWAIWVWSAGYRAWIGDPPARGPFRTQREALAEAKARAEGTFAWRQLGDEREREGLEAMHAWRSRS